MSASIESAWVGARVRFSRCDPSLVLTWGCVRRWAVLCQGHLYFQAIKDFLAPPPVKLPVDPAASVLDDAAPVAVARTHPTSSLVWARLAEQARAEGEDVQAYAFARTGYHRGLDALRANGWKGFGSVPWSHEPNRGVLLAIAQLALCARAIGEDAEYDRCRALLSDCDPACVETLLA